MAQNDHGPGPGGHLVGVPGQDEDEIVGPVVKDEIEKVKLSELSKVKFLFSSFT